MSIEEVDYKAVDAPSMLSRIVKKQDQNDPNNWIIDLEWYNHVRQIYSALVNFIIKEELLLNDICIENSHQTVIMYSELNPIGKALFKSGAVDRWMGSFDRSGSKKKFNDVRYLERSLRSLVGSKQ